MGQVPFYPPNVSGWDQGSAWLNTNSAHAYWQTTDYLIRDTVGDPGQESASAAVSRAISALSHPWVSNGARTKLEAYAQSFFDAHKVRRRRQARARLARARRAPARAAGAHPGRPRRIPVLNPTEEHR